ncbi:inositol monophosphatase [Fulvimarina sp. 2208YS6-2-32]|uniref:Inositol monophosphatase n=1 Tax=Fulvimarina uroteuthidis TaxID=3098149 RepID=A0ABU5I573_9HYPH|nr:inositol monophosphatase [Fulvimarina sp. 2208YS6-2-32]MDY8110525.1 inositol monophosphatase [Fulvimarina sp. 2208YS6-2-32]
MADNPIDLDRLTEILKRAGAETIMPSFRNLEDGAVREKSSAIDLVTEADEAAERFIKTEIDRLSSGILFVGEESTAKDRSLLDKIADADVAVIVDPIDGTSNFAAGIAMFSVMAAVTVKGEVVSAVVHDPVTGDTVRAEKGGGTYWLLANGDSRKTRVNWPVPLDESIGIVSSTYFEPKARSALFRRLDQVRVVANYRNSGHEYRMLATGGCHFNLYGQVMPWDHAPGTLLVSEAGGHVAFADGEPYHPSRHHGVLVSACSRQTHRSVTTKILGIERPLS